ncbi:MalonylCoA decarboxylase [Caligus rogercresseyi]|uniref:MalonylCoA decarboxylase n=1 Tax=Caligus rogercresseyi TaxID=217165 RepID=A0A7T8QUM2_CALRO|nr:MalonylCoA decarboxylase [Caligus rogercresseyi]
MRTFSTLSPIPGFKSWLLNSLRAVARGEASLDSLFIPSEQEKLSLSYDLNAFIDSIKTNKWAQGNEDELQSPLMRLCSRYLHSEKHRGAALDSVANFHLRNGATLWRLNWKGDISIRGLSNSCGMMVNYRYFTDRLEENSTQYQETHTIDVGDQIATLSAQADALIRS